MSTLGRVMPLVVCMTLGATAKGQNAAFMETLKKNSAGIGVQNGKLSGPGAEVLKPALADAQFVLLGEDHGIQQIPEFAAALCTELAAHGFQHMALEIGPYVVPEVEKMARSMDGMKELPRLRRNIRKRSRFTTGTKSSRCCSSVRRPLRLG